MRPCEPTVNVQTAIATVKDLRLICGTGQVKTSQDQKDNQSTFDPSKKEKPINCQHTELFGLVNIKWCLTEQSR